MFMLIKTFILFISIYVNMNNNMGTKIKFTEKEKEIIVNMYLKDGYQIPEIIKRCNFSVSKQTIYNVLNEKNISLIRKTDKNHNDIIGKIYGHLKVIKIAQTEKSGNQHKWRSICNCDCGKKNIDVAIYSLGKTISCGCDKNRYLKITGKNNTRYGGYEELSGRHWGRIKKQAEERGIVFNIEIEDAWNLFLKQNRKCALSGMPIKFTIAHNKNNETASLDRIDSKKGYVEGNIQWVHKHINMMKSSYEQNYFISLCELVTKNNCL